MSESDTTDLSVVICCFNSAARLRQTLEHLKQQVTPEALKWEVLLVDNNSSDDTPKTAVKIWQELGSAVPIRVIEETKPGTAYARKKGILEADSEFILFCDDDNHLANNYIDEAIATIRMAPCIAVVAGNGKPILQTEPPSWLLQCFGFLACEPQSVKKADAGVTGFYTAGMILRRQALLQVYENFRLELSGRVGNTKLAAGEDLELCLLLAILGYQLWGNPALTFGHAIAMERIDWQYVKSLRYAAGTANAKLAPTKFVAQRRETSFKSRWSVQFLAALLRICRCGLAYPFNKRNKIEFWYQLGRLSGFWSCRQSYGQTIKHMVRVRHKFTKAK